MSPFCPARQSCCETPSFSFIPTFNRKSYRRTIADHSRLSGQRYKFAFDNVNLIRVSGLPRPLSTEFVSFCKPVKREPLVILP